MHSKLIVTKLSPKVERYSLEHRSVLLIDSGVGLLSIARAIHKAYPEITLFAICDQKGFPWGPRKPDDVIKRCLELAQKGLKETKAEAVVLACNTATTVAIDALRSALPVPVIGVIPAIKPAAQMTKTGRIGLLATEGTVRRPYIDKLIEDFASDCYVVKVGAPHLALWAENKIQGKDVDLEDIAQSLHPFEDESVDVVTLGCTHYALLIEELEALSKKEIQFLDTGPAVARQLARKLAGTKPQYAKSTQVSCLYYTGEGYHISQAVFQSFGFQTTAYLETSISD